MGGKFSKTPTPVAHPAAPAKPSPIVNISAPANPSAPAIPQAPQLPPALPPPAAPKAPTIPPPIPAPANPTGVTAPAKPAAPAVPTGKIIKLGGGRRRRRSHAKKTQKVRNTMRERIVKLLKSKRKGKKYAAIVANRRTRKKRIIHFGAHKYEQFKDSTGLGYYTRKNHGNKRRRQSYFSRHSGIKTKAKAVAKEKRKSRRKYNAKILSHVYLW
jgi:hypothetical protein